MHKDVCRWVSALLVSGGLCVHSVTLAAAQTAAANQAIATPAQVQKNALAPKPQRRRYTRRATTARPNARTSGSVSGASSTQVGPTDEQRRRDQLILAVQQQQSAEIARQNAVTTGNIQKERAAQQAEPRIQDAPGPGSQPLAGEPIAAPAQSDTAPRIQDAPGPAQTLPQAPAAPANPPATQTAPPQ